MKKDRRIKVQWDEAKIGCLVLGLKAGKTLTIIGKEFGVSSERIAQVLRANGINPKMIKNEIRERRLIIVKMENTQRKELKLARTKHLRPIRVVLKMMKQRCYNKRTPAYKWYGGRGISFCPEWRLQKNIFVDWALKNGYQKGLEIDRIDNNGNYEPTNCRFVTKQINLQNRRPRTEWNMPKGESNSRSKLTEKQVIQIRGLYENLNISCVRLGKLFGVSEGAIYEIIKRMTWKHIPEQKWEVE